MVNEKSNFAHTAHHVRGVVWIVMKGFLIFAVLVFGRGLTVSGNFLIVKFYMAT